MKLELTLPALERLIAGDTELELGLKKQIVQEFAKQHLVSVAKAESFELALEAARQYVNQAAKEAFDIENLTVNHLWPTVGPRLKAMIETHIQKIIDDFVQQAIEKQKVYLTREIDRAILFHLNKEIGKRIKDGIQERLEAATKITNSSVSETVPPV